MYERFESLLRQNKVTSYRVSRDTGIAQATLSDWKRGISVPKTDKLLKLSSYFGVSIGYFLEGYAEAEDLDEQH